MTEPSPPLEPVAPAPETKRRRLAGLDPGWATVIAAVIAVTGTVLTLVIQAGGGNQPTPASPATPSQHQSAQPTPATPPPQGPSAQSPSNKPTISVVSALPEQIRGQVVSAADSLRTLSLSLPLLMRDDFQNNDYGWGMGTSDYAEGVSCTTSMTSGTLQISVVSGRGPAYCYNGVPRKVRSFALVTDLAIPAQRGADVGVLFGDGAERELVMMNPQSQSIALYKGASTLLGPTFVDDINQGSSNRLHLIVLERSMALFINDKLALLGTDMPDPGSGTTALWVRLNEANQTLTLQSDHMELRGDAG